VSAAQSPRLVGDPPPTTPAPANRPTLGSHARFVGAILRDTADRFSDNEGFRLGAAFSYYAMFSIFPLLLLAVTAIGFVLGDSAPAREQLLAAIASPASPVRDVLDRTLSAMQESQSSRGLSAVIGVLTLLFGASGAFVELDAALNRIWCVPPRKTNGIMASIRLYLVERLSGIAIVLGLGLTLLVSLASSSLLSFLTDRAREEVALPLWPAFVRTAEVMLSMMLLSGVFTAAFHFIPRSRPPVRVVLGGAVLTTVLLSALKEVFASYLSHLTSYSAYGIAGGVLALTTWIYLSSQIILFGAQLTRIHAEKIDATRPCPVPGSEPDPAAS
jgi:membrane protein